MVTHRYSTSYTTAAVRLYSVQCTVQSVTSRSHEFSVFLGDTGKFDTKKKVPEPLPVKFGTEKSKGTNTRKVWYPKKYRNQYWKNLVPKKSTCIGKKIGCRYTLVQFERTNRISQYENTISWSTSYSMFHLCKKHFLATNRQKQGQLFPT